jgi:hypothetical protein
MMINEKEFYINEQSGKRTFKGSCGVPWKRSGSRDIWYATVLEQHHLYYILKRL